HERVLYVRAMHQLTGDGASAQRLLLPLTLEFTAPELEAIDAHRELLRRVGYEVEPFSGRAVVVHTAPNPHPRFDAARCFGELVADLAGGRFGGLANRLERSEEHTSELQSRGHLVCRLLLEKKKQEQ